MFSPGETTVQRFTVPFTPSELSTIIVTYRQDDHIVLIKTITSGFTAGATAGETAFEIALTQQESLMFKDDSDYYVQINVYTTSGSRATSKEMKDSTGVQHYKKVISQ